MKIKRVCWLYKLRMIRVISIPAARGARSLFALGEIFTLMTFLLMTSHYAV